MVGVCEYVVSSGVKQILTAYYGNIEWSYPPIDAGNNGVRFKVPLKSKFYRPMIA